MENKTEKKVEITKDDIQAYEDVRQSGVTNMFDVGRVVAISGLTREQCMEIMKNYDLYMTKYKIERG